MNATKRWKPSCLLLIICGLVPTTASCRAQEQYPKPLVHTPSDHPAARVIVLNIDGLHAIDLARWVEAHPHSSLAELTARGVTYTNAHTPIADPAAGLLAPMTGGTPVSTGIISVEGYDRTLSPAGSDCKTIGATLAINSWYRPDGSFDPSKAALDPARVCTPVQPHQLLRVNTIFEVVREKIGPTAWAGSSPAITDLLRGLSGKGLNEACGFGGDTPRAGDEVRTSVVLRWIRGRDCKGDPAPVPALFGMDFAALDAAQTTAGQGYLDANGTPSLPLSESLAFIDAAIGRILQQLKAEHLYGSTWIFVTSAYGNSPMDRRRRKLSPISSISAIVNKVQPALLAHIAGGDAAILWLRDSAKTEAVITALSDHATALSVQDIDYGARLALTLNPPAKDARMPDIILQPEFGVVWGNPDDTNIAAHGGTLDEDTHVALLVSGAQLTGRFDPTYVPTTQLGALLLRSLGMEKFDLKALHLEHSPALPGIF